VTDACISSNLNGADTVFMAAILDKPLYSDRADPCQQHLGPAGAPRRWI